mmetsp:Transcript_22669/g.44475  ORF Transcript_22669/g.44475 Transcript_22669/m.44475 type:complete len:539 (-) Transcript_22669:480-2096(-)|eukprot:CAMPEP_0171496170 /NCGR_PEP_ID=MMETSP0958-20121227/6549_1 /TAXON_ID=87120 /ORGANISM="Aurantiochytrium limacinum, Strain ATCCMYA-1381" /LENGTH=538 /DNA_ID=CAMNT_0012030235 /DNA_START=136 /DNA_END=1752 /DNA_ORIENTATION=-
MASPQIQVGSGVRGLLKDGYKEMSGLEQAIMRNIEAVNELGRITRTSLGPTSMNKLVVNHLEKILVTSDAATIVGELEVEHPAASMVVMAAKMQEQEFGDCTNFVITFASELLNQAQSLLRVGVHASEIVRGYKRAAEICLEQLHEVVCDQVGDVRDANQIKRALRAVVDSKKFGYGALLADLGAQATTLVIPPAPAKASLNVDNVRIAKLIGGNIHMSAVLKGMMVRRPPASLIHRVENAKVAVFGSSVEAASTETKGTVCLTNADELLNYNRSEEALMEEQIKGIKESGVDVIISGGSLSEMALHFINRYEMMAIKITSKWELRRLCRTVGATALVRLGPVTPDEMGFCDLVETREIAGGKCVVFQQNQEGSIVSSVVLRSSTTNQLDDLERAMDDAVNTVKTYCSDARLLPGGGATEIAMATRIAAIAEKTPGLEQYALNKFAEALEVVPRTLAENAGDDPNAIVSDLYAAHKKGEVNAGVDVETHGVSDMKEKGIFDTFLAKHQAFRLATDVAITILRIDSLIMSKRAGGPKKK